MQSHCGRDPQKVSIWTYYKTKKKQIQNFFGMFDCRNIIYKTGFTKHRKVYKLICYAVISKSQFKDLKSKAQFSFIEFV
jgi:hypothetical protein